MRSRLIPAAVVAAIILTGATASAADFSVSAPTFGAFVINGAANPSLALTRGRTYTFDVNTPDHPFYIKTAQVTGSASTFDTGVTNNGAETDIVSFAVPPTAPAILYYQCGVHSSMTGTLFIVDATTAIPAGGSGAGTVMFVALALAGVAVLRRGSRLRGARGSQP